VRALAASEARVAASAGQARKGPKPKPTMAERAARALGEQQVAPAPPAPVGAGYILAPTPAAEAAPPATPTPPPSAAPSSSPSAAAAVAAGSEVGVGSAERQARVEAIRQQQAAKSKEKAAINKRLDEDRRED